MGATNVEYITFSARLKTRTRYIHLLDVNDPPPKVLVTKRTLYLMVSIASLCVLFCDYEDEMRIIEPTFECPPVLLGGCGVAGPLGAKPGC